MTATLIEFLLGLYFIGVSLPLIIERLVTRQTNNVSTIMTFAFGIILLLLALYTGISIAR